MIKVISEEPVNNCMKYRSSPRAQEGFTLIELIVVMAIMVVVTGLVSLSVSAVNSATVKQSAVSVDYLISKCRAGCLGRSGNVYLTLSVDGSGNIIGQYYENDALVSTDTLPGQNIIVSCTTTTRTFELSDEPLTLSFDRSTGAQKSQSLTEEIYCTSINFLSARSYTIKLVSLTGNHSLT